MFECVLQARCDVMSCDHCCNTMDAAKAVLFTNRYLLWKNAAAVLGLACVAVFAFKQLRLLYGALHAYVMTLLTLKNLKKYGSWAGKFPTCSSVNWIWTHEANSVGNLEHCRQARARAGRVCSAVAVLFVKWNGPLEHVGLVSYPDPPPLHFYILTSSIGADR